MSDKYYGTEGMKDKFFKNALSDFTHDVASGRAICHLVDLGYTTDQIMRQLDYPTPRNRVEETVYRHMTETGILLENIPEETYHTIDLKSPKIAALSKQLRIMTSQNGEENSYLLCPFGSIHRDRENRLNQLLAPLTGREKEYILGVPWPMGMSWHRLNSRMYEIGLQLAITGERAWEFYFLKTREILKCVSEEEDHERNTLSRIYR